MNEEIQAAGSVLDIIRLAVEQKFDAGQLKVLFDLQCRHHAIEAERAFNAAMNACQTEMPTIIKDKENTSISKMYAPLETIKTWTKPVYARHGFALSFSSEPGREVSLTTLHLDVAHVGGHSRRHTLADVPLDDKGPKGNDQKTKIQGLMSAMSYAQGRLICLAFNLTVADEDRDGQVSQACVGQEQIRLLNDRLAELREMTPSREVNMAKFLAWLTPRGQEGPIETLAQVRMSDFTKALAELDRMRRMTTEKYQEAKSKARKEQQ